MRMVKPPLKMAVFVTGLVLVLSVLGFGSAEKAASRKKGFIQFPEGKTSVMVSLRTCLQRPKV